MNTDRLQKIKVLVQTSSLLNKEEREDWMNLLELMNDKQILELEKILSYKAPTLPASGVKVQTPLSLSHIMNFPKPAAENLAVKKPEPAAPKAEQKSEVSRFGQWLKTAIAEKELPAGKPEPTPPTVKLPEKKEILPKKPEPILPQKSPEIKKIPPSVPVKPAVVEPKPLPKKEVSLPEIKPIIVERPKEPTPLPEQQPAHPLTPEEFAAAGFEKAHMPAPATVVIQEPAAKQDFRKTGLLNFPQNFSENSAALHSALPQKPGVAKPLVDSKASAGPAVSELTASKKIEEPKKQTPVQQPIKPVATLKVAAAKELSSVSNLTLEQYRSGGAKVFANTLGAGIKGFGYHKAILALEHSPLYAAYINTGLKLLSDGKSFEDLTISDPSARNKYFSREEFEMFTDLLREVPASV